MSRGGPVNIDLAAAKVRGVTVLNTSVRTASAVAEFIVGSLPAETRTLNRGHYDDANGVWSHSNYRHDYVGPELCEMTVGIVGYGDTGTRVTKQLQPFGRKILIYDAFKAWSEAEHAAGFEKADLDDLLAHANVVTLYPRVPSETKRMIARARIARRKRGSYFVNAACGQVLAYDALYDALVPSHLKGVILDRPEQEPPPMDMPHLKVTTVAFSPHIAGSSRYAAVKCARMSTEDIARLLDGQTPPSPST